MKRKIDYRDVTAAYEQRKMDRMIASGSTAQHAYEVMAERRRRREAGRAEHADSPAAGTGN
jgi:hypothetical protein